MVQDFAKIKPEPVLEKRSIEAPSTWSLLFTGLVTGIAVGVFGCFLLYLSGNIPPLQSQASSLAAAPVEEPSVSLMAEQPPVAAAQAPDTRSQTGAGEAVDDALELRFYEDLQNYVVEVDATPVPLEPAITVQTVVEEPKPADPGNGRLIQIGAFHVASSAQTQLGIVEALGIDAFITRYARAGSTLHAVQAGPFNSTAELNEIRALLQRNDIDSIFVDRR